MPKAKAILVVLWCSGFAPVALRLVAWGEEGGGEEACEDGEFVGGEGEADVTAIVGEVEHEGVRAVLGFEFQAGCATYLGQRNSPLSSDEPQPRGALLQSIENVLEHTLPGVSKKSGSDCISPCYLLLSLT